MFKLASVVIALVLVLTALAACNQRPNPPNTDEFESFQTLFHAPEEVLQSADNVVREHFGDKFMQQHVTRRFSQTYPAPTGKPSRKYAVAYEVEVQGPDYARKASVIILLDDSSHVTEAHGLVNCAEQADACPPFRFARSAAIDVARQAGIHSEWSRPLCPDEDLIQNLCVHLWDHPDYKRYVWRVESRQLNWRFWEAEFWECDQQGQMATVDAATGRLYGVVPWCLTSETGPPHRN